jgi:hypothetical protein
MKCWYLDHKRKNLSLQLGSVWRREAARKSEASNMKLVSTLILFLALFAGFTAADASKDTDAAQAVETLRYQLLEVEVKEAELQGEAKQLDEALRPENIERALAGIGSTKPEELRELRRRQLTIERDGVLAQLKLIATSKERLESVIRTAETGAYQQSAEGVTPPLNQINQMLAAQNAAGFGWRMAMMAGLIALVVGVLGAGIARRAYVFAKYSCSRRVVPAHHKRYAR